MQKCIKSRTFKINSCGKKFVPLRLFPRKVVLEADPATTEGSLMDIRYEGSGSALRIEENVTSERRQR